MDKNSSNNNALPKSLKDSPLILKGQNVPIVSADLAPVHYSGSKQLKIHRMETENKIANRPIAPGSSDIASSSGNLAITMKEKLSLNPKSVKNVGKNGMRLGTTDVEVHCGTSLNFGLPSNDVNKVVQENLSVTDFSSICLPNCQQQYSCMSSQEKISNSQLSTSKPISSTCTNYHVNSVLWKPEINFTSNGAICNGHTISEATSSNSIAVSDFSLSSDKSTSLDSSYSCSGARPRKRNASSNSSSQSIQPHSECEVGLSLDISSTNTTTSTSDLCKVGLGQQDGKLKSPLGLLDYSLTNVTYDDSKPTMPNLNVNYVNYENENQMEAIMKLIQKDLSEPYSIYTYRYFIHNWPKLCFLAMYNNEVIGAIVCKLDVHKKVTVRGYIAMLAVDQKYRKKRIGSNLVQRAIREMTSDDADEVVLETEITNKPALQLYENLGFVRDKRLFRYYLNGVDALRLKLWLR